jgi:protein-export membrane protein SecD
MLARFPAWKAILISLTVLVGVILCLPNVLPKSAISWLPTGAMRLGLDLQGGASILLEVDPDDLKANYYQQLSPRVRSKLSGKVLARREAHPNELIVTLTRPEQTAEAIRLITELGNPPAGSIGQKNSFLVQDRGNGAISVTLTQEAFDKLQLDTISASLEGVRRRVDATGTVEPNIQKQGSNRIVVEVPGLSTNEQLNPLVDVLTQAGVLTFKMVDMDAKPEDYPLNEAVNGRRKLEHTDPKAFPPQVVIDDPIVQGTDISRATQGYDQSSQPAVDFGLNPDGAKKFGDASSRNVGQFFAIILDDRIVSAPRIHSAITGGSGQISGSFTIQEAQNLSLILRSGALPAKLKVVERRVISASLGADSIKAGVTASAVGFGLVVVFMLAAYGLLGFFAILALAANIALLIGFLSGIGATLTLPGIAGVLLTIGMAVDANVLIFERIREEKRHGRSPVSSVDIGYNEANATIFDANFTHFLAGIIMYFIGTGPVKGFALTLVIGIISSYFTAVVVARWIMALWLQYARPKAIPI